MHSIGHLLHLISISFAIGLAYIALDRFRYSKHVRAMLSGAIEQIQLKGEEATPAEDAKEDTAIALLRRKLKDISTHGVGLKLVFDSCPRMFGVCDKNGWDFYLINVLIVIEYIALLGMSLFPEAADPVLYCLIVGLCIFGTLLPVFFIYAGMKAIKENESFIEELFAGYADATGYDISISQLKDKLNNNHF